MGETTELFRLPHLNGVDFLFRLSIAKVGSDGPFSLFPGIDRILMLLEGNGFLLNKNSGNELMNQRLKPLSFTGEEVIDCKLIQGPCRDFNVMTDRNYAHSSLAFHQGPIIIKAHCHLKFIYDTHAEILYKLERGDEIELKKTGDTPFFVIDVTLNEHN